MTAHQAAYVSTANRSAVAVPDDLAAALTGDQAMDFCRFMRSAYFSELRLGHVPAPEAAERPAFDRAVTLHLLRPHADGNSFALTDVGYEVSNVAKEYTNWVEGGRQLPDGVTPALVGGKRLLDVGCSFGRHLLGFSRHGAKAYGIDFQDRYLRLSRTFAAHHDLPAPRMARAKAERLPFRAGAFDVVFSRLVLNYVSDIDATLDEFVRVLAPDGVLVLIVEPLETQIRELMTRKWIRNSRNIGFTLFGLLNTALVELGGRQLRIRRKGRMHAEHSPAWPSARWLNGRLAARGLQAMHGRRFHQGAGLYLARKGPDRT